MRAAGSLELASLILGPFDEDHQYVLYEGYVLDGRQIFIYDEGTLWLRHVHKAPHMDHLYIDGDTGGIILAENFKDDARVLAELIVSRLRDMDALTFLTDVLLWTPDRVDMNLKLDCLLQNERNTGV